jgi:5'-3' exonuclease
MILVDLSQVMLSNLMVSMQGHSVDVEEDLLRHMILNSLRSYNTKFKKEYGEMIITCDAGNNWRKTLFPYYKANRKKNRDQSKLDWNAIFTSINKVRDELKDYFPYRVIHVDGCEADDAIGVLCHTHGAVLGGEPILIISGDKDFQQLQIYSNVSQYDPVRKKFLKCNNPTDFLHEHTIRGDVGDGVPNFLSADDILVSEGRQTPIKSKNVDVWLKELNVKKPAEVFDQKQLKGWLRNHRLINLNQTPHELVEQISNSFNEQQNKSRDKLFNYFIKFKLKNLMEAIGDF